MLLLKEAPFLLAIAIPEISSGLPRGEKSHSFWCPTLVLGIKSGDLYTPGQPMSLTTSPAATVTGHDTGGMMQQKRGLSFTSYYKLAKLPPFSYFPYIARVRPTDIKRLLEERRKMG